MSKKAENKVEGKEAAEGKQEVGPKVWNINGTNVTDSTVVEYVAENPKRKNSKAYERFEKYKKAKTIAEFFSLGGTRGDLRYDEHKGFVTFIK